MDWLSLDMLAHVYYIVVKTYSLHTKGYIHSIYHSGLFYSPEKVSHTLKVPRDTLKNQRNDLSNNYCPNNPDQGKKSSLF